MARDDASSTSSALAALLETLSDEECRSASRRASARARELGLRVARPQGDVPISVTLTAEVISRDAESRRARDAALLLSSVLRTARWVLETGTDAPLARILFGHFGALETAALAKWQEAENVTIARVDWFLDDSGAHRALELNATIPAMQAYSDAAAAAWIETLGAVAGLSAPEISTLVSQNGSNAEELRRSIVAHSGLAPAGTPPSIAILHRENDSQLPELRALRMRFEHAGHRVLLATPAEVTLGGGDARIAGEAPDILYRHIFARRMPEGSALEAVALGAARQRLQNPINGHLEVKGLFAELSRHLQTSGGAELGLTDEEREALGRVLPWTRLLESGPCVDPDGAKARDLVALVAGDPSRYVLKRSWDYGGKSVLIGPDVLAAEGPGGWQARVQQAFAEAPGTWVVQELVRSPRRRHLVAGEDDARWEDVFVDASTFTASGAEDVPGGGVVRFARTGVVNIAGGGGVAPLVRLPVAQALLSALKRRQAAARP